MSPAEQTSEVVCLGLCTDGSDGSVMAEEEEVQDYRVKCLNNLAAAQLKLERYDEALHTSRDVLTLEPNNVKALFRAGKVRARFFRVISLRGNCEEHLIWSLSIHKWLLQGQFLQAREFSLIWD